MASGFTYNKILQYLRVQYQKHFSQEEKNPHPATSIHDGGKIPTMPWRSAENEKTAVAEAMVVKVVRRGIEPLLPG